MDDGDLENKSASVWEDLFFRLEGRDLDRSLQQGKRSRTKDAHKRTNLEVIINAQRALTGYR